VQHGEMLDEATKTIRAALDLYFLEESGTRFKVSGLIVVLNEYIKKKSCNFKMMIILPIRLREFSIIIII
jgi:hypothetical protein